MSWSLDESRSAEPYTPPPKPHIGIETPVVNSKPHPTLTNNDIKIMIAKDVASQHTKLALHTIRTNAKEAKGGGGLLHRNVTNPARNEDQRHDGVQIERVGPGSRRKTHQATAAKHDPRFNLVLVPSATEIFP